MMIERPCERCGSRLAEPRKHIGVVGENWIELDRMTWLCATCERSMRRGVDQAIAINKEATDNG